MKVPFVDLSRIHDNLRDEITQNFINIVNDSAFIGGKEINKFEESFSRITGVKNTIAVGNGTDSIYIILRALGIGLGDEVITVSNTWISTSETISQTGAKPVFVDIDEYFTIDSNKIESKITQKTKAIIAVHLYGQSCDMNILEKLCKSYNLYLIEDCAQSHLSQYKNRNVGSFGDAASYSFYPGKNLGAFGDAGCISTNNDSLAKKCRMIANHGALIKHEHQIEGINSRMDTIQASVLLSKLPHLNKWNNQRIKAADLYSKELSNIPFIQLPKVRKNSKHTFHLYVIRAEKRDELMNYLNERGIGTAIHYPTPLPFQKAYSNYNYNLSDFSISKKCSTEILSLPIFPGILSLEISYVSNTIREFYEDING